VSPGSNGRIGSTCVGVQLLYSPVPVLFGSPVLAALECPKMVGPLSDAPFFIVINTGTIEHVFNLGCCGGPLALLYSSITISTSFAILARVRSPELEI
jgi:hypothetical protein